MERSAFDETGASDRGLMPYRKNASDAAPRYIESAAIVPLRTVGIGAKTTLKATFWHATIQETPQAGDPDFVSIALNTGGGRVWRNAEATPTGAGAIAMQPFEGAHWRFEGPVSFTHIYVPFSLVGSVSESLFEQQLSHAQLRMSSNVRDDRLCSAAYAVHRGLGVIEPTNLVLDSWAVILAEILVRRFSSHAQIPGRGAAGKLPARGIAHAVGYIEASIAEDLRLESLADAAGVSVYHFARGFREMVGMSPHAYVLARRLRRAQLMLQRRESRLADVALACGFASQAHLTTAFQRNVGVTPGEYRRIVLS